MFDDPETATLAVVNVDKVEFTKLLVLMLLFILMLWPAPIAKSTLFFIMFHFQAIAVFRLFHTNHNKFQCIKITKMYSKRRQSSAWINIVSLSVVKVYYSFILSFIVPNMIHRPRTAHPDFSDAFSPDETKNKRSKLSKLFKEFFPPGVHDSKNWASSDPIHIWNQQGHSTVIMPQTQEAKYGRFPPAASLAFLYETHPQLWNFRNGHLKHTNLGKVGPMKQKHHLVCDPKFQSSNEGTSVMPQLYVPWFFKFQNHLCAIWQYYMQSENQTYTVVWTKSENQHDLLEELIISAIEWKRKHYTDAAPKVEVYVYNDGYRQWRTQNSMQITDFHDVFLPEADFKRLMNDLNSFRNGIELYKRMKWTFKRSYMFYGPPGTGKTSTIRAIASKMNMNLAMVMLTPELTSSTLMQMIRTRPTNSLLVLEDLDRAFEGIKDHPEKLSGWLGMLDGVLLNSNFDQDQTDEKKQEPQLILITANDEKKLPEALVRAGRVDYRMYFDYADQTQVARLLRRVYETANSINKEQNQEYNKQLTDEKWMEAWNQKLDQLIESWTKRPECNANMTMAQVTECIKRFALIPLMELVIDPEVLWSLNSAVQMPASDESQPDCPMAEPCATVEALVYDEDGYY